jgi:LmbE family N-acetylglucosaminyl deacetylase
MSYIDINHHAAATGTIANLVGRLGAAPVVLAVWSHPDDESFLAGGLLAQLAGMGARVVNVSATSGEHGTDDPANNPPAVLGALRERELDAALAELGVGPSLLLGFEDGACEGAPDLMGTRLVGRIIDRVRPDLILSFGPDGVTGHPDHQAVARWTRAAVDERGDRLPLILSAAADVWPEFCIDHLHSIRAFWPGYPSTAPTVDVSVVSLTDESIDRKLAALDRHHSQMVRVREALGTDGFRLLASIEGYRPANFAARELMTGTPERTPIAA